LSIETYSLIFQARPKKFHWVILRHQPQEIINDRTSSRVFNGVLEETPERVKTFLVGIAAVPEIETTLDEDGGMTEDARDQGRALLTECTRRRTPTKPSPDTPTAKEQRKAQAILDAKDKPTFQKAFRCAREASATAKKASATRTKSSFFK
jgi:hypothetical protein